MKKIFFLLFIINSAYAQPPGQWMWIHGSSSVGSAGNFGTQGVPSPTNVPPAMYETCEWTDQNGNFWIYGGLNTNTATHAALWKYEPATNQWTWMKGPATTNFAGNFGVQGVPSPSNLPPSLSWGPVSWVDLQNNLWMFGGYYSGSGGNYSALWKYEIATNTWTWMQGPNTVGQAVVYGIQTVPNINNMPGGRSECPTAWTDNAGDLWLFGGTIGAGHLNDLWRFNIATNTWTWMKGSSLTNQPGVYGTLTVENPANTPGGRMAYAHWKDNTGNLWLFGGAQYISSLYYNDLWRYNPVTNNWTWMNGSNISNSAGIYGAACVAASANTPGSRFENRAVVTDQNGNFWMFGGTTGYYANVWSDLWLYCVSINQWTWVSGNNSSNPAGNWGTINVPNPANIPNGRAGAIAWYDNNGHLYLFGGTRNGWGNVYNDLWRYTIDPDCYPCNQVTPPIVVSAANDTSICAGSCVNISVAASGGVPPLTYAWAPNIGNGPGPHLVCPSVTTTYSVQVMDSLGNTISDSITVTVNPSPVLSITNTNVFCYGDTTGTATVIPNGNGPFTYLWNTSPPQYISVATSLPAGNYIVTVTDANGCYDTMSTVVSEPPLLTFTTVVTNPSCIHCCDGTITLNASGGTPAYTQTCNPPGNPQYCPGVIYVCCVTDNNGCTVCDTVILGIVSVMETVNSGGFTIYPNPASDELIILFPSALIEDVEIKIYDIIGKELLKTVATKRDTHTTIDTKELNDGIYVLQINLKEEILKTRIIIRQR